MLPAGGQTSAAKLAEREGFEPSRAVTPYTRSRRAPSTTRPPLLRLGTKRFRHPSTGPLFEAMISTKLSTLPKILPITR